MNRFFFTFVRGDIYKYQEVVFISTWCVSLLSMVSWIGRGGIYKYFVFLGGTVEVNPGL